LIYRKQFFWFASVLFDGIRICCGAGIGIMKPIADEEKRIRTVSMLAKMPCWIKKAMKLTIFPAVRQVST
jgi:hypothetical protein